MPRAGTPIWPKCWRTRTLRFRAEIVGLREDVSWCRDVIATAVERLHQAHVDRLEQQRRYHRLLDDLRAIRSAQRDHVTSPCNLPDRVTGDDDHLGPTCH
jgi:hypothetical protein